MRSEAPGRWTLIAAVRRDSRGGARTARVLQRAARAPLGGHALARPGEIAVRIVGEEEGRALNLQYRGKDYATNVLTFDYAREPVVMADLVLCGAGGGARGARAGQDAGAHYAHCWCMARCTRRAMTTKPASAMRCEMEALEILLLGALGFANPY